jgi:hypothetical protein
MDPSHRTAAKEAEGVANAQRVVPIVANNDFVAGPRGV